MTPYEHELEDLRSEADALKAAFSKIIATTCRHLNSDMRDDLIGWIEDQVGDAYYPQVGALENTVDDERRCRAMDRWMSDRAYYHAGVL